MPSRPPQTASSLRHRRWLLTLGAVVVLIPCFSTLALANPYIPDTFGGRGGNAFVFVAFAILALEYLVLRHLLRKDAHLRLVLPGFVLINAATFPLMHIAGSFVMWFAELVPLALEPMLFAAWFRRYGIQVPKLERRVIGANLVSFAIGLAVYPILTNWEA
ncbi:MAG: hypothetical protein AAF581_10360 [Planctomycetota bacterium]